MHVRCLQCGYESGEHEDPLDLMERVRADGGSADDNDLGGADFRCPRGHGGDDLDVE